MNDTVYKLNEIKVEVTHKCPLWCVHCSSESNSNNQLEMPWVDFLKIAQESNTMKVKEIAFSGGEPLVWNNIFDAVDIVSRYEIRTLLYTSGNVSDSRYIFKKLKSVGLDSAIFSVYGSCEATHEEVTKVKGSFKRTIDSINQVISSGIPCELHFVPMATNFRELPGVATLARDMGIGQISVLRLVPQGRSAVNKELVLNQKQNLELRKTIQTLRQNGHKIRLGSPYNSLMLSKNPKCHSAIDRLTISPDLKISPCDAFKNVSPESLGVNSAYSSLKTCSLLDAWFQSPFLQKIRSYLGSVDYGDCATCEILRNCASGCLAQKYYQYGYLAKKPDPMCLRQALS